ncbi:MAG TPA: hypothetical protein VGE18_03155 [Candidatus Paceibacterota bacterium]
MKVLFLNSEALPPKQANFRRDMVGQFKATCSLQFLQGKDYTPDKIFTILKEKKCGEIVFFKSPQQKAEELLPLLQRKFSTKNFTFSERIVEWEGKSLPCVSLMITEKPKKEEVPQNKESNLAVA